MWTGASAGIGRATALALAAEGAAVVVADVDAVRGPEVVRKIEHKGGQAVFVATDAAVAAMVETAVATFGGIDFACNNAGIEGTPAPTGECTRDN